MPVYKREEFLIALAVAVIGAWVLYLTSTFTRPPPMLSPGLMPHQFPQLMVYVLFGLCAVLVFQSWRKPQNARKKQPPILYASLAMIGVFSVLVFVNLFLAFVGFFVGLSLLWGERRVGPMLMVAIGLPLAIFLLFDLVLEVRFPRGLLTSLYYDR